MLIITHSFKKAVGCTMDYIKSCHLLGELILKLLLCLPKLLQYMASSELVLMRGLKKKVFSNKKWRSPMDGLQPILSTVRLTPVDNQVPGNQEFHFAHLQTIVGQVKKGSPTWEIV